MTPAVSRARYNFLSSLCRFGPLLGYFVLYFFVDFASVPIAAHPRRATRPTSSSSSNRGHHPNAMPGPGATPAAAVDRNTFSFPSVPVGMRDLDAATSNAWWDEEALYLDHRGKVPASSRFFKNVNARPDMSIFDPDVVMQNLALFGHFVRLQRPVRETSWWHTGEMKDRRHTIPFITGDNFRMMADFFCDNEIQCALLPKIIGNMSHPVYSRLKPDQSIIIFTTCHDQHILFDAPIPLIEALEARNNSFVIIVHNGDETLEKTHEHFLEHPQIKAYFTQNCGLGGPHPKVVCVPIGIEPRQFSMHGWRPEPLMGAMVAALQAPSPLEILAQRKRVAFAAWSVGTYKRERMPLLDMIELGGAYHADHVDGEPKPLQNPEQKPLPSDYPPGPFSFVTIGGGGQLEHYHRHIINHAAVLAPRGNGLDTLRAWEALYLGRPVITKNSTMNAVFDYFPVHILSNWTTDLNEKLVHDVVKYYSSPEGRAKVSTVKLFMFYWFCEVGRAANRADEWCSIKGLEESLRRPEFD